MKFDLLLLLLPLTGTLFSLHSGQYGLDGQGGCYKNLGLGDLFLCVWGLKNRFPENQNRFGRPGKPEFINFTPFFVVPIWQKIG